MHIEQNERKELTILFSISGNSKESQEEDYQGIKIDEFFQKPIRMTEFVSIIQNYINSS